MGNCKTCKFYEPGFDGKPGICKKLVVADTWQSYDNLLSDGVGCSDELYDDEISVLYVGEDFGCIHYNEGVYEE